MGHVPQAVCIGEAMALLVPEQAGPLEDVTTFRHSYGGAEANVARGLAALGFPSAWVSRVGADGFGRRIVRSLAADGVHTSAVTVDPDRPTGLYVKEIGADATAMHYYRRGSAASALGPGLLDEPAVRALLDGAGLVHVSGITAALSDSALALLHRLLAEPRRGRTVSFDLNWRPALWRDRDPKVLRDLCDAADVVLCGADEAAAVLGTDDPLRLRALLPGPRTLVVKDAGRTATAVTADGCVTAERAPAVEVVEEVGAGDSFAAGYLAGALRGDDQQRRLRLGHLAAASTLVVPDDHGAPPPHDRLQELLGCSPTAWAATRVTASGVTTA
ncbi:MAG TPA: sugar kinase [Streptomyces sp.]|nr:sugar kinase [Streptomyces sp.]